MVEIFFGIITRQAIRRGTFRSVQDLTTAIGAFIDAYNDRCEPFAWTRDNRQNRAVRDLTPHSRAAALLTMLPECPRSTGYDRLDRARQNVTRGPRHDQLMRLRKGSAATGSPI
jgi:hypothetical protein